MNFLSAAATLFLLGADDEIRIVRDIEYATADGISLRLDAYLPIRHTRALLPSVVYVHGGGWRFGDKKTAARTVPGLARKGVAVFAVNYRLSTQAKYPAAVEDVRTAVRWVREHASTYLVDPERIGIWGTSAGGHLAMMTAFRDDPSIRLRAAASWAGPTDLTLPTTPWGRFLIRRFLGGGPDEIPEIYREAGPIHHVNRGAPPLLLVHGDQDRLVILRHSLQMLRRCREAGVPVELLVVRNAGHGFIPIGGPIEPSHSEVLEATYRFFLEKL